MGEHMAFISTIDVVLDREILGPYADAAALAVEKGIDLTGMHMKAQTKRDAPVDDDKWKPKGFPPHRPGGTFKAHIAHRRRGKGFAHQYKWYVKVPEHRLTHLLANGHRLFIFGRDAHKRTNPDPFVHDAFGKACAEIAPNVARYLK